MTVKEIVDALAIGNEKIEIANKYNKTIEEFKNDFDGENVKKSKYKDYQVKTIDICDKYEITLILDISDGGRYEYVRKDDGSYVLI